MDAIKCTGDFSCYGLHDTFEADCTKGAAKHCSLECRGKSSCSNFYGHKFIVKGLSSLLCTGSQTCSPRSAPAVTWAGSGVISVTCKGYHSCFRFAFKPTNGLRIGVDCSGLLSCRSAKMQGHTVTTACRGIRACPTMQWVGMGGDLDCSGEQSCTSVVLTCGAGKSCTVKCSGAHSCGHSARLTGMKKISCVGHTSCRGEIRRGFVADCTHGASKHCQVDCLGYQSCSNPRLTGVSSLSCIGANSCGTCRYCHDGKAICAQSAGISQCSLEVTRNPINKDPTLTDLSS